MLVSRLAAVFGATYCLGREVKEIKPADDRMQVTVDGKVVSSQHMICNLSNVPKSLVDEEPETRMISHVVCLTTEPIGPSDSKVRIMIWFISDHLIGTVRMQTGSNPEHII